MLELLESPATPVAEALARLEDAVSSLVGIVRVAPAIMVAADEARLHAFACQLASAARTTGAATVEYAGSAHVDVERARAASIGEAIERYSATYVPDGLKFGSAAELGSHAVPPESFALFHERQYGPNFPFAPFTRSTRLSFVEGFSLADGRPALLPAQLVYLHYGRSEPPIGYPTSNGLACGPTLAEAVLAALLEVVGARRDDARLGEPALAAASHLARRLADPSASTRRYSSPTGLRYTAIDTSAFFGVPAAIGVVHGAHGDRAAVGIGAGCAPRIGDAWRTGLAEAFAVHRWLRGLLADSPTPIERAEDVRSLEDHTLFHGTPDRAEGLAFLEASGDKRSTTHVRDLPGAHTGRAHRRDRAPTGPAGRLRLRSRRHLARRRGARLEGRSRGCTPQLCALDVFGAAPYRGGERLYRACLRGGSRRCSR